MSPTNSEVLSTVAASPAKVEVTSVPTSTVPIPSQPGTVEEATTLNGDSSPASTPETLLTPIASDEESDVSDTLVIVTANPMPSSASQTTASHVISPQEAATIVALVAPSTDNSQWIAGVKYTELPEGPLKVSNVLQSSRWYAVYRGRYVGVFPSSFIANGTTLRASMGEQGMFKNQQEAVAHFNAALGDKLIAIL